jgi:hypothetical protein
VRIGGAGFGALESGAVRAWRATDGRMRAWSRHLAQTWPSGAMGMGVMAMLLALLLSYYLT